MRRPVWPGLRLQMALDSVLVTEKLLDGADIIAVFQQMGGEAMAEGVAAGVSGDSRRADGGVDRALQAALVQMVAARRTCGRIARVTAHRKDELRGPFPIGVGILPLQGIGERNRTGAARQLAGVGLRAEHEVGLERLNQRQRQHRHAILLALPVTYDQLATREVEVLHAQAQALEQA